MVFGAAYLGVLVLVGCGFSVDLLGVDSPPERSGCAEAPVVLECEDLPAVLECVEAPFDSFR